MFLEKLGIIEVYDVGILSFVFVDIVEITEDIDIPIYQEEYKMVHEKVLVGK